MVGTAEVIGRASDRQSRLVKLTDNETVVREGKGRGEERREVGSGVGRDAPPNHRSAGSGVPSARASCHFIFPVNQYPAL
jgi:hypothetical protein